jgi:Do/DeqQ family serine protease
MRIGAALLGLLAAGLLLPAVAGAQTRPPDDAAPRQQTFAPLVKKAAPAVVNVYSRRVERVANRPPPFDDPFFRRFFGDGPMLGVPRERVAQSLGSGVIVEPDGVIVTNNHVIEGAQEIVIALADRREFEARLIAADPRTDLAVLRIDPKGEALPHLELRDSDEVEVGDMVLAIGNPFGVGQTVTSGIVSALGRTGIGELATQSFIQTDAAINPGNSGGALIALDGRLIGVNTAIFSRSGGSLGIGFAIPSNLVATTVAGALGGKGIRRPWLGVGVQPVTGEIAAGLGLARAGGVLVSKVYPGGPADKAGIKTGDVVLQVDGREVFDDRSLRFRVHIRQPNDVVKLDTLRDRKPRQVSLKIDLPPETPPRKLTPLAGNQPLAGANAANLSPALAEELGINPFATGVIIVEVAENSPAARIGARPGDIVLKVNDADIGNVDDLQNQVRRPRGEGWRLALRRADKIFQLVVRG